LIIDIPAKVIMKIKQFFLNSTHTKLMIFIFIIAFLVRPMFLASGIITYYLPFINLPTESNFIPDGDDILAINLLEDHGIARIPGEPSFERGPIYTMFIALVFFFTGKG